MGNKTTREALKDSTYDGQDFTADPGLRNGPLVYRKCTDVLFWLLFVMSLGCYGYTCFYGFKHGKPRELFTPVDGDGRYCGEGVNEEYPYLYYVLLPENMQDPRAVCVKDCPDDPPDPVDCQLTSRVTSKQQCSMEKNKDGVGHLGYGTFTVLNRFCVPDIDDLPKDFKALDNIIGKFGLDDLQEYVEDVKEGTSVYVYAFFSCLFVIILYTFLVYYFTGLIVWATIISTGVGIVLLALWLQLYHNNHFSPNNASATALSNSDAQKIKRGRYLQAAVFALLGLAGVYFVCLFCLFKDIAVSVSVMKTAAIVVLNNLRVLLMPLL